MAKVVALSDGIKRTLRQFGHSITVVTKSRNHGLKRGTPVYSHSSSTSQSSPSSASSASSASPNLSFSVTQGSPNLTRSVDEPVPSSDDEMGNIDDFLEHIPDPL
eukprot:TRINITY_DN958_c0_g1_i2.p1 TRINITY_DN958_c0_g1~~TRINITY_DN958_c0_g1_i2.p1  ORF type:complete len:105 (+),score=20.33 TRINITY_DN958_c0_g1_i2:403-717(+)